VTIMKELGRLRARTGIYASRVDCKHNHMTNGFIRRYRSHGGCVQCKAVYNREHQNNDPELRAKKAKTASQWNKDNAGRYHEYQRKYQREHYQERRARYPERFQEYARRANEKRKQKRKQNEQNIKTDDQGT
jgi:hypothetical protein